MTKQKDRENYWKPKSELETEVSQYPGLPPLDTQASCSSTEEERLNHYFFKVKMCLLHLGFYLLLL